MARQPNLAHSVIRFGLRDDTKITVSAGLQMQHSFYKSQNARLVFCHENQDGTFIDGFFYLFVTSLAREIGFKIRMVEILFV